MNDANGEILEEVAYSRDVKECFGGEKGQGLSKKLYDAGGTITSAFACDWEI